MPNRRWPRWSRRLGRALIFVLLVYICVAYVVFPLFWRHYEHMPRLEAAPKKTYKTEKIPGDPLNVALVGTRPDVEGAMAAAGWRKAAAKTILHDLRVVETELFDGRYPNAPVSDLFLYGRRQDLAFEQAVGRAMRSRHHVRFWLSPDADASGRPIWLGAATFDRSVGLSRRTGQITHHIAPAVDAERDKLMADLERLGLLERVFQVTGIGPTLRDVNGEKDWYFTDGEMTVGVLSAANAVRSEPPVKPSSPSHVRLTNRIWKAFGGLFGNLP
ncbi:MAG: LssY C-terminal domain-containing protein [Candidatus Aminicenantes bacterium]|nr:LssY C-terminal domain-containing protein [Candidatus Aminicenantes bacterium]